MSTPEERAVQEALPMDATEAEILEKLKKDLGEEMIAKMSLTQVLQCIRGWQTEKDRYDATITNVRRIIEFKEQARTYDLLTEPNEDVDFFLKHWGSEIYGQDAEGHYIWMEGVRVIHAPELLDRFDDEHMKNTRSVLMEALEIKKGNVFRDDQNPIYKHIYVFDLSGVAVSHFSAGVRRVVKNVVVEMGNIYPESVTKMIFVNAPFIFRAIWGTITPWLHPITKEKTQIVGSGKAIIKAFEKAGVSIDNIPESLGGTCKKTTLTELIEKWRVEGLPGPKEKVAGGATSKVELQIDGLSEGVAKVDVGKEAAA